MSDTTTITVPGTWATNPVLNSVTRIALLMASDPTLSIPQLMALTGEGRRTVDRARAKVSEAGLFVRVNTCPDAKAPRYTYSVAR